MVEHVEGEWKTFVFRMLQQSDLPEVMQHLKDNFYKDEPLSIHSIYDDAMGDETNAMILHPIKRDPRLSFVVLDKASGKIIAVRLTSWVRRDDIIDTSPPPTPNNHKVRAIGRFLNMMSEEAKIFERHPDVQHYADFAMVSVDRKYRGHGLAGEIYDRSIKLFKALHIPLVKCVFTSPITQLLARRRGFKEIFSHRLNEWKDENGQPYWPNATNEECAILMIKELH